MTAYQIPGNQKLLTVSWPQPMDSDNSQSVSDKILIASTAITIIHNFQWIHGINAFFFYVEYFSKDNPPPLCFLIISGGGDNVNDNL